MGQFLQGGKNGLLALQKLTHMQLLKGDSHTHSALVMVQFIPQATRRL